MEELEDRLGDKMEDILDVVKESLREQAANSTVNGNTAAHDMQAEPVVFSEYQQEYGVDQWDYDANEVVFDDHGEGVGIECDLDVDDD